VGHRLRGEGALRCSQTSQPCAYATHNAAATVVPRHTRREPTRPACQRVVRRFYRWDTVNQQRAARQCRMSCPGRTVESRRQYAIPSSIPNSPNRRGAGGQPERGKEGAVPAQPSHYAIHRRKRRKTTTGNAEGKTQRQQTQRWAGNAVMYCSRYGPNKPRAMITCTTAAGNVDQRLVSAVCRRYARCAVVRERRG
jgi:hypothetical protein